MRYSLAIHLHPFHPAFLPTLQEKPLQPPHHPALLKALAKELQCEPADIVDFELNVCDTVPGTIAGALPFLTH